MKIQFGQTSQVRRWITCLGIAFVCQSLIAAVTWVGGGADNNWATAANWSDNAVPTASTPVEITVTGAKTPTISIAGTKQCASLTIKKSETVSDADASLLLIGENSAYLDVKTPVASSAPVVIEGDLAISDVQTGTYVPQESATLRLKQNINTLLVSAVGSIREGQPALPEGYEPVFQGKGTVLLDEKQYYHVSYTSLVAKATFKDFRGTLALENGAELLNYQRFSNVAEDLDPFPSTMTLSFKNARLRNNEAYVEYNRPLRMKVNAALKFEDDGQSHTNRLELGLGLFNLAGPLKGDGNVCIRSRRNGLVLSGDNSEFRGCVDLDIDKTYLKDMNIHEDLATGVSGLWAGSPHAVFVMNSNVTNVWLQATLGTKGIAYRLRGAPTATQSELHLGALIATNLSTRVQLEPGMKIVIGEREDVTSRLSCKFYMDQGYYDATLIKKGKGVLELGENYAYETSYLVPMTKLSPTYWIQEGTLSIKRGTCGHFIIEKGAILDLSEPTPRETEVPRLWTELGCRSKITSKGGIMKLRMKKPLIMPGQIDTSEGCHLIIDIDEMPKAAARLIRTNAESPFTREELRVIEIRVNGQRPAARPSLFIMEDGSIGIDPKRRGTMVLIR